MRKNSQISVLTRTSWFYIIEVLYFFCFDFLELRDFFVEFGKSMIFINVLLAKQKKIYKLRLTMNKNINK